MVHLSWFSLLEVYDVITLEEQIEECRRSVKAMGKLVDTMARDRDIEEPDLRAAFDALLMAEAILATMESVPALLAFRNATATTAESQK